MKTEHSGADAINMRTAWRGVLKPVGRLVIAAQLALVLQPLSVLAQERGGPSFNPTAQAQLRRYAALNQSIELAKTKRDRSPADIVSDRFGQAHELVSRLKAANPVDRGSNHRELRNLLAQIQAGADDVRREFAATRIELQRQNMPAEIMNRHDEAVAQFEARAADFGQIAAEAHDDLRVARLAAFFDRHPAKRKPAQRDARKLPWSTPKPTARLPAETQTSWFQNLYGDQRIRLAQAAGSIGPLQFTILPEAGQAPVPADLAETDEVQITPQIRAKAQELGHNPVNITNWVRNHIEWIPTAGAIQSAQDTLDKKRGNATDTASLLIALLRASNIPARYQWGTIDVEAGKAMNWVGGVTRPEAAQQLLGQGGIANRGLISGGRIAAIRMEHVWVQAYVNWAPSRGSRNGTPGQHPNPNAHLNAWIPLDASYKQYAFTAGMDLKAAVPLNAQPLLDAARQGATVNEAQGWVQNLNQSAMQAELIAYQDRLKAHIDASPSGTSSTVGDVIGRKIIPHQIQSLLAGTLAHPIVTQGIQASAIPSAQQHQFTYRLYASQNDQAYGSPLLMFTEKTSRLAGKRLTLSYVPATQADADLIASYLPKPHADGSPIQPSELPTSLPAYLIRLKPTLTLDGQVVAQSGTSVQMGTDLPGTGGFTQLYDPRQWDLTTDESNVAGNATVIGISAGGVSAEQLNQLKARLGSAKDALQSGDTALLSTVSGEQLSGDLLTATLWSWFAAAESHNRLSQNQAGVVENPGLSYGLFHAVASPVYSWGVIRKVTFPGVNMDIGHVRNLTWAKDNDQAKWVAYNRLRGQYMSALEHAVPERFFNDPNQCNIQGAASINPSLPACPQGVSAVKALALAAQAGQKIYTITPEVYQANPNIVSTGLAAHSGSTRQRVQQALEVGHEVTIHEAQIAQDGWSGAGFIVIDPSTGAGGYLIEGGLKGGTLIFQGGATLLSLASLVNGLQLVQRLLGIILVGAGVSPFVLLLVGAVTLLSAAASDDVFEKTAATQPLALIYTLAHLSALLAVPGAGVLFALVFTFLLIYVALMIRDLVFARNPASLEKYA